MTMSNNTVTDEVHEALNPPPAKRASKKASVVETPAERTARMLAIAESTSPSPATEPTKRVRKLANVEVTPAPSAPAKRTAKATTAKKAAKRSTRPEADESKIKTLIPKLAAADKITDKDKAIAARTKLVDEMLDAGATWTAIANARQVSMSTARGQHRRAGGRMTR
jgi:hypothetical protein